MPVASSGDGVESRGSVSTHRSGFLRDESRYAGVRRGVRVTGRVLGGDQWSCCGVPKTCNVSTRTGKDGGFSSELLGRDKLEACSCGEIVLAVSWLRTERPLAAARHFAVANDAEGRAVLPTQGARPT
ncbi:unnamed protein product [Macrosiphum euphorbiae]|uniref:Uncharacterized protein n=1 Tax=Macrosiphum euphorbiae TaxID=13131 RepID=A0AAV0WBP1_9HEMI|nr:unnamed protein product [Macrosiphum euphorbiae]CAI6377630.1 unnamed protein product [Macrosiphum euphorbiae]